MKKSSEELEIDKLLKEMNITLPDVDDDTELDDKYLIDEEYDER